MVISLKDLIKKVRIKLNENPEDEGFENGFGHDALSLDRIIASVADEVCEQALDATVFSGFDDIQNLYGEITVKEGYGVLELPADFHKFIELKISGWEIPATTVVLPGEDEYWRKGSVNPSVRGTRGNPRVYLAGDRKKGWLELCPCEPGATVEYGSYLCNPWLTPVGSYYLPDRIVSHITTKIAERVLQILKS